MSAQSREHDIKEFVLWCRAGIAGEERLRELLDAAIAEERERCQPLIAMLEAWINADDWECHLESMEDLMIRSKDAIRERTR